MVVSRSNCSEIKVES